MKTISIYTRKILERTGFAKYPYKEVEQFTIIYDKKEIKNHLEKIDNPRLKVKFELVFKTRSEEKLKELISKLHSTDGQKWLKEKLLNIVEKENV